MAEESSRSRDVDAIEFNMQQTFKRMSELEAIIGQLRSRQARLEANLSEPQSGHEGQAKCSASSDEGEALVGAHRVVEREQTDRLSMWEKPLSDDERNALHGRMAESMLAKPPVKDAVAVVAKQTKNRQSVECSMATATGVTVDGGRERDEAVAGRSLSPHTRALKRYAVEAATSVNNATTTGTMSLTAGNDVRLPTKKMMATSVRDVASVSDDESVIGYVEPVFDDGPGRSANADYCSSGRARKSHGATAVWPRGGRKSRNVQHVTDNADNEVSELSDEGRQGRPGWKRQSRRRKNGSGGRRPRRSDDDDEDPSPSDDDDRRVDSQPGRQNRKEVKVDNYAGDTSVEAYLAQFQLIAECNEWPRRTWATELAMRLRGEARNLVLPNSAAKVPSYDKLCRMLRERFGTIDAPSWYVAQLRGRRRKDKESVPELLQWMTSMGAKAYPEVDTKARMRVLTDFFVNALTDEQQGRYVLDDEPNTINEAAKSAMRYEGIHRTVLMRKQQEADVVSDGGKGRGRYVRAVSADADAADRVHETSTGSQQKKKQIVVNEPAIAAVSVTDTLAKQFAEHTAKVDAALAQLTKLTQEMSLRVERVEQSAGRLTLLAQRPASGGQRNNNALVGVTCFQCGKRGHIARDCNDQRGVNKCFTCGKVGHFAKQCYRNKQGDSQLQGNGAGRGSNGGAAGPMGT
jgi:hypothetical protein